MTERSGRYQQILETKLRGFALNPRIKYPIPAIFKNSKNFFNCVPLGVVHGDAAPLKPYTLNIITRPTPSPQGSVSFIEIPMKVFYKRPYGTGVLEYLNQTISRIPHGTQYRGWYIAYEENEHITVDMALHDARILGYIRHVVYEIYPELLCGWFLYPQSEYGQTIIPYHMIETVHHYDFMPVRDRWSRTVYPYPQESSWYGGYPQWWVKYPVRIPLLVARTGREFWRGTFDEELYRQELETYLLMLSAVPHRLIGVALDSWWSKKDYCRSILGTTIEDLVCTYGWYDRFSESLLSQQVLSGRKKDSIDVTRKNLRFRL